MERQAEQHIDEENKKPIQKSMAFPVTLAFCKKRNRQRDKWKNTGSKQGYESAQQSQQKNSEQPLPSGAGIPAIAYWMFEIKTVYFNPGGFINTSFNFRVERIISAVK